MNIGMLLDKTFPPDPRVENEAVSLIKAGHKVFLFCLTYGGELMEEEIRGIQVKRYISNKITYKFSALAYTVPVYSMLLKGDIKAFLKEFKIDVIHIHDIRVAEAAFWANKTLKLPTVLDLHDNMPEILKYYPHMQKFPGKYLISSKRWKQKEESFIEKASKVITVSNEFIAEVVGRTHISPDKIKLVPNTVLSSFYEEAIIDSKIIDRYKNKRVLLYLGDTGLRRGLQTAIEALPLLKDKYPNIKLVIVGKNSSDAILKKQVKALDCSSYVDFEGWQNVSLFPSYIVASTVCLSPLHRNIQHDVAYANKLFQYMSFSRPLLVSNATAQKTLIERTQTGLVHLERDAADFAEKVATLFNDDALREKMGVEGKSFIVNEFCWEKASKNLIELYKNIS
ncbi:MAG: glycosyl transferase [Flavobacteriaceae bacterium]|nr:MAG: glycosyl transferase [Flavobacteriaceae bacterium]